MIISQYMTSGSPRKQAHRATLRNPIRAVGTLVAALMAFFCLPATSPAAPAGPRQPHIVHIVADDLGWKDVGFNGCTDIKTPNIDRLAAGGAKFTQFYVQPMCTPTRACLMTGRY